MKILAAQLNPTVGDLKNNLRKILDAIEKGKQRGADIVLTPELAVCGYPPEDFLLLPHFLREIENIEKQVLSASEGITVILGTVRRCTSAEKNLFNTAAIIHDGRVLGYHDKNLLPTYDVFDERRYFSPGAASSLWKIKGKQIGVLICEDIWQHAGTIHWADYPCDPVKKLKRVSIDLLLVPSASPYSIDKPVKRLEVCAKAAKFLNCPLVLANQVGGNDSLIFDGHSAYLDNNGQLVQIAKGWQEELMLADIGKKSKAITRSVDAQEELYEALVLGIRDYFIKCGFKKAVIGLSGGIDSAVVACLGVAALGSENILGVAMPSRYSSEGSVSDATLLANNLKIPFKTISIESPFKSYLELLQPHFDEKGADTTEENLQSRIRGMILMALSNKLGYILLSTGNKSELAMGYATLYGDMCGGLAVISDLTKQQVYKLARWINRKEKIIPLSSITKPPSAELRPDQKDSDSLPDYSIVDAVLKGYVENHQSPKEIAERCGVKLDLVNELIRKIHLNEFKRRQAPMGLRVSEKAFCIGRHFPIVQGWMR